MAKRKRLTESFIDRARIGWHGDGRGGHGLRLRVHRTTSGHVTRRFYQQLRLGSKVSHIPLGWWPAVSLQEARIRALENAVAVARGKDPRDGSKLASAPSAALPVEAPAGPTFREAVEAVIEVAREGWRRPGPTEAKWRRSVKGLRLASRPVGEIEAADILRAITPVWKRYPTKARVTLQIVSRVCRWAVAAGYRKDDPVPAVRAALPRNGKRAKHFKAAPVAGVREALAKIRAAKTRGPARLALEFVILTASRSREVLGATWGEIDLEARVWTVPADRMKSGREHRVPLSAAALAILERVGPGAPDAPIFPNERGAAMHRNTVNKLIERAGLKGRATVHGFRSTFRDWCGEQGIDRTLAELSLAHRLGDATEQAYSRADLLERRRVEVMEPWGLHVTGYSG